jgi:hypothetical protein
MIKVLTLMNNLMNEMNLPYTFDKWDADLILPHWIGEISEVQTFDEDGENEYSFILTGFGTDYTYLFGVVDRFKKRFKTSEIVNGIVVRYNNAITVSTDKDELKQVQINFTIKDWSVE